MDDDTAQHDGTDDLDRIAPSNLLDLYLSERESDLAWKTRRSHRYAIEKFVAWCDENGIQTVADLDGRDLHEFRSYRRDDLTPESLRSQLGAIRQYLRFAESIEAAPEKLAERIIMPETTRSARESRLDADTAETVLDHLSRFQYASRDHALLRLLWTMAIRVGTARSFDLGDFDRDEQTLQARHRPETDTPLKNADRARRLLALDDRTTQVLADFVDHNRPSGTDEHGREPLFLTEKGRIAGSTVRRATYRWTRPCYRGDGCPHDRDPDECDAKRTVSHGSKCPSTVSPHDVRRGAISKYLAEGTPARAISDRADVSEEVLDKHYDARSERERAETRREFFE
jgi:site-specific recombinase XerD